MDSTFSGSKPLELSQMEFAEGTKKGWNIYNLIVFANIVDCVCNIAQAESSWHCAFHQALFIVCFNKIRATTQQYATKQYPRQNSIRDTAV
jgi:hypothetical protein